MTYLLDVSTLIAALWKNHSDHDKAVAWLDGKRIAVCPITELGFLRVATCAAFGATMRQAREILQEWLDEEKPEFVTADLRALEGAVAPSSAKTTDWYLANLALKHGMKWATLDANAGHPAAVLATAE